MSQTLLQIPPGVQCFYDRAASLRRAAERRVADVFRGWSYDEILLPLFDHDDVFALGGGPARRDGIYRFIGREGEVLALRPDFTALVAKVVASRMRDRALPLRLFYSGEILRHQLKQAGGREELFQIGLEHIGDGLAADLEILLIALESLERLGVHDGRITVGHAGFIRGLFEECQVSSDDQPALLRALRSRAPDQLKHLRIGRPSLSLVEVMQQCGGIDVLTRAARLGSHPACLEAVKHLRELHDVFVELGVADRLQFDLGEVRGFDYYTGMVFDVHAAGAGMELGGGGRYDSLLGRFGWPRPAVGFSFSLDRLVDLLALEDDAWDAPAPVEKVPLLDAPAITFERARALRERGVRVEVE